MPWDSLACRESILPTPVAAPRFRAPNTIPSSAAYASTEGARSSATREPRGTPRVRRWRAIRFARCSSAAYVVCSRPKTTATSSGRVSACASKISWRTSKRTADPGLLGLRRASRCRLGSERRVRSVAVSSTSTFAPAVAFSRAIDSTIYPVCEILVLNKIPFPAMHVAHTS